MESVTSRSEIRRKEMDRYHRGICHCSTSWTTGKKLCRTEQSIIQSDKFGRNWTQKTKCRSWKVPDYDNHLLKTEDWWLESSLLASRVSRILEGYNFDHFESHYWESSLCLILATSARLGVAPHQSWPRSWGSDMTLANIWEVGSSSLARLVEAMYTWLGWFID